MDDPERKSFQRGWNDDGGYFGLAPGAAQSFVSKYPPSMLWRKLEDESRFWRLDYESQPLETTEDTNVVFKLGVSEDTLDRTFGEDLISYQFNLSRSGKKFATDSDFPISGPNVHPSEGIDIHNILDPENIGIADFNEPKSSRRDIFTYNLRVIQ